MYPIESAPRDGRRMIIIRKSGFKIIGRWETKTSFTHEFGWHTSSESWLSDDDKFIDVAFDPVVGWDILPTK